ncbi:hypothetical protein GBF38_012957 [Nibea albiflora]|uniref:Uncharacterized protein n=1 Tax=Nibea albiflora TaxID=240163 RepID=A0ACB7F092_NIBAL|nr:hypothetical protein GBF38_012957 [Nibea albiflora]
MMWLIFCTCILSARHRLQVLAAEMKDSLEDKRDVPGICTDHDSRPGCLPACVPQPPSSNPDPALRQTSPWEHGMIYSAQLSGSAEILSCSTVQQIFQPPQGPDCRNREKSIDNGTIFIRHYKTMVHK